jgi:hypothetical protein
LIGLYAMGLLMAAQPQVAKLLVAQVVVAMYFLAGTLACIYLYRFRVMVDATSIRTGAFSLRAMDFADVVQARYVQGGDSGQIVLHDRRGRRIRIGNTLNGFWACAREIDARLPKGLSVISGPVV